MSFVTHLQCVECGGKETDRADAYVCSACGGNLDVLYDYAAARVGLAQTLASPRAGIWRWLPLLPVAERPAIPLRIGGTPLVSAARLARALGIASLEIKDDGRNPSASLKDRASAVVVARALEAGITRITCASTGNAASSLATIAASVGIETIIFVPETIPRPKLAQLLLHGARVVMIRGDYDAAYDLSLEATRRFGWLSRNSGFNPFLSEGKKTVGFEIADELDDGAADAVFVGVGDGCILGGVHKAFTDLRAIRDATVAAGSTLRRSVPHVSRVPALYGVQAEGASPLVAAFRGDARAPGAAGAAAPAHTFADSIAVGRPRDATKALRAVRDTGGEMIAVSDDEIREAMRLLARDTGIFAEPAGAAGFAGLLRCVRDNRLPRGAAARAVVIVTGSGLKDVESALSLVEPPRPIEPDIDAVAAMLKV